MILRRKTRLLNQCVPMQIRHMLIGYARVSTDDQDLRLQRAALKEAECRRILVRRCPVQNGTGQIWLECLIRYA